MLTMLVAGGRRPDPRPPARPRCRLWVLAASAVLVCLVFFPQERFRIPIIDPALVVLGGLGSGGDAADDESRV